MRTMTEWWIFKDYPGFADWWDGPFKTRAKAAKVFNRDYRVSRKKQVFVIVKSTQTPISPPPYRR
jgi:hypothetical protein